MKNKKQQEPIAIVGMAFRFPGDLSDEQSFWQALRSGKDSVTEIGSERWATDELSHTNRSEAGRSVTFSAGVLSDIEGFDAAFFGISPREAAWLDPQQRLLLELTWNAMENGGQVPSQLAGSDTAVFVGLSSLDYGVKGVADLASISSHTMTGNALSMASNRLSYIFDLHGPSMTVDTACSSSIVAVHQACQSLHSGESPLAIVGSINLLLHPYPFVGFTKASMISEGGRSKAFDASADGYVRSEGGAVLLLKTLSQAKADGDNIHALILGSGVNADGSRKTGITIPSAQGQAELMRRVLKAANLDPSEIDYLEAHGTGTAVGDPIETKAIGEIYGKGRKTPLPIGSVKTNLGHLEAASGMAGLVKSVLMLKQQQIPPSLHFETPNPNIDFNELNIQVATGCTALSEHNRPVSITALNSFGFGGTNAHALLQSYPAVKKPVRKTIKKLPPLFLSAKTDAALKELAGGYAEQLGGVDEGGYYDIAYSAAFHREHLDKRLAVEVAHKQDMVQLLQDFSKNKIAPEIIVELPLAEAGSVAFVYTGNGAHWAGMGQQLLKESKRFAAIMKEVDAAMVKAAGFSVLAEIKASNRLDDTSVAQPVLFAMQVAITTLLRERGIQPKAAMGHSVGEVAAAWAAGILSLEQAIHVVFTRSKAQAKTKGDGRMAAVGLSKVVIENYLAGYKTIEIAGINSPNNITVSGDLKELEMLEKQLAAKNVFFRLLDLDYAFHSRAMDPIKEFFWENLGEITPTNSNINFVSTVSGDLLAGNALNSDYWWDNIRKPVRFADAINSLITTRSRIFVEIGPQAILQRYVTECLDAAEVSGRVLGTLRCDDDSVERINETALKVHLLEPKPELKTYFPQKGQFVSIPTYPWQHERFALPRSNEYYALNNRTRVHPLLGWRLKEHDAFWENVLDESICGYLKDHRVAGSAVFPASGYVEIALAAAREYYGGESFELEELTIFVPIVFDASNARSLRVELSTQDGNLRILSRERLSQKAWVVNATCRLLGAPTRAAAITMKALPDIPNLRVEADTHYRLASTIGLDYGPSFQGFAGGAIDGERLDGKLALPEGLNDGQYVLHPVLLDSCFQCLVDFFRADIEEGRGAQLLPVKIGRLRYYGAAEPKTFHMRIKSSNVRSIRAEFVLLDEAGKVICVLENCVFRVSMMQQRHAHLPAQWSIVPKLVSHPMDYQQAEILDSGMMAEHVRKWLAKAEVTKHRKAYFENALPLLDALITAFTYEAFSALCAEDPNWLQDVIMDPSLEPADCGSFFLWLLEVLQASSLLKKEGEEWHLDASNAPPPAKEIWRSLLAEFPEMLPELLFIGRVGQSLPDVLAGKQSVKSLSHEIRVSYSLESFFDNALPYKTMQSAQFEALQTVARGWPKKQRLRILHISEMFNELPADLAIEHIDYIVASSDSERLSHLKAEYHTHPFIKTAAINPDMSLSADSKLPDKFDVIILSHWLHNADKAAAALEALQNKMAPGGQIIIAERYPNYSANFIFGLEEKWWRNQYGGPVASLALPEEWEKLLVAQGFDNVECLNEPADNYQGGSYLILAQNLKVNKALAPEAENSDWLFVCDKEGVSRKYADALTNALTESNSRVNVLDLPLDDLEMLKSELQRVENFKHVIYLTGIAESLAGEEVIARESRCLGALHLVQALESREEKTKLWIITCGGALVSNAKNNWAINPDEASLWGFGRVVMNEYPGLSTTLIDVAPEIEIRRLVNELLMPDGENEIVLTEDARFGLRMQHEVAALNEYKPSRFKLDFNAPGQLRNLHWVEVKERELKADEIKVQPAAVGLNFRDVMYAMGMLPEEAVENGFSGASLGLEFAGIVSQVGGDVSEYKTGDSVIGFGPACFASHIITKPGAVTFKPEGWSFTQAATVPTTFFTVYYALKTLADLQPSEKVLIHGAAGGIGIAAIQMAKCLGAEIFATAGSDEKRDFVDLLGADHVFDSRSLAFADDILAVTNGEGVDVVLNSLAGEAINRNLRALKPFGRFLELGKRDFYENTHIGLRPFKNNISYFGIDADQLLIAKPQLAAKLFREMMELFADGTLSPLPYRAFTPSRVVEAFRHMQQSRHIGKIVVDLEDAEVTISKPKQAASSLSLKADASYLVTGGMAGFGLESARFFTEHGAKHLVLLSRQGMNTADAEKAIAELEALGACCHVFACDITDYEALAEVFTEVQKTLPPLRGILHAAMVLDDGLIGNLSAERFNKVLAPKITGAMNLHKLSLDLPLDYFICYSSITTALGNPGQGNYVAANAYLEAFTLWRRRLGLPAHCIGWGPIGDAGYLTRNAAVKDNLAAKLGAKPLESKQAFEALISILKHDSPNVVVADFAFASLSRLLPSAQGPRFELLQQLNELDESASDEGNILSLIAGKSSEEVEQLVQHIVITEVGKILSVSADRVDITTPLNDLGMDSLMTVELVLAVEDRFGINFSAMELSGSANNIERIVKKVAEKLSNSVKKQEGDALVDLVKMVASQHEDGLTADELSETVKEIRHQEQNVAGEAAA